MKVATVFLLLLAMTAVGADDQMTVGDLHKLCTSSSDVDKTACRFYIWGVTEGADIAANVTRDNSVTFREAKEKAFCLPESISQSAMELAVRMKIGEDLAIFPADRDQPAVSFIVAVLRTQFPCGKHK